MVVYIDPVEVGTNADKADYILITYSHPEHLSMNDITKLKKLDTKIKCSKGALKTLKKTGTEIIVAKPNDTLSFNDFQIEAVPAYNTKSLFL